MKNPQIGIIIPPSPFLCDERVFPPLGTLRVAASLRQADHPVDVIDTSGYVNYEEIITQYCKQHIETRIFGIGCTTPQFPYTQRIIRKIREVKPEAKIILGGVHVTTAFASLKKERKEGRVGRAQVAINEIVQFPDVVVSGDGERAIHQAVKDGAPSIIDADDPDSSLFLQPEEIADFPFPARDLIDLDSYHYQIDGKKSTSIIAQLGCPLQCSFCGARFSPSFRRMRLRSFDNVLEEIREVINRWNINGFFFLDDELNVNKFLLRDLQKFREFQDALGIELRCRGFLKSELITPQIAQALYDCGFRNVLVGFEAADERILENIRKMATIDDNNRAMDILHAANLKTKALMSCGHAGESEKSIEAIRDWLIKVQPDDFDLSVITPYLSTPYYDLAVEQPNGEWMYTAKNGDKLYMQDMRFSDEPVFYKGIPGEYKVFVRTDKISSENIAKMRDWVEKDVREKLNIPFYQITSAMNYEHSMGQGFPPHILRSSVAN